MDFCFSCKYFKLLPTEEPCHSCIWDMDIEQEPYNWEPAIENDIENGDDIL